MTKKEKFEALREAICFQENESIINTDDMYELISFVDELASEQVNDEVKQKDSNNV